MTDQNGHRQRLWERYLEKGLANAFHHPYEKLEFLLTFAIPRKDTKPLAKKLLHRFGSLNRLFAAPLPVLTNVPGVGRKTAGLLKLFAEMALVLEEERLEMGDLLNHPELVKTYLRRELAWDEAEYFMVLFLDSQNRLIKKSRLFRGTLDRSVVYPREVIKEGLACNAAGVLIAHNHPSGVTTPSAQDLRLTRALARALKTVGMNLLDHFIVGKNEVLSLRGTGDYLVD